MRRRVVMRALLGILLLLTIDARAFEVGKKNGIGRIPGCSAFVASRDLILTAFHCLVTLHTYFETRKGRKIKRIIDREWWKLKNAQASDLMDDLNRRPDGFYEFRLNGKYHQITRVAAHYHRLDYALLELGERLTNDHVIQWSFVDPRPGTKISFVAYPNGKRFEAKGKIVRPQHATRDLYHSVNTRNGCSGGPLLNDLGFAVGMHQGRSGGRPYGASIVTIREDIRRHFPVISRRIGVEHRFY